MIDDFGSGSWESWTCGSGTETTASATITTNNDENQSHRNLFLQFIVTVHGNAISKWEMVLRFMLGLKPLVMEVNKHSHPLLHHHHWQNCHRCSQWLRVCVHECVYRTVTPCRLYRNHKHQAWQLRQEVWMTTEGKLKWQFSHYLWDRIYNFC